MMQLIDDQQHPVQMSLFDEHDLAEVEENGVRYILCHNPFKKEEDRATRQRLLDKTEEKLLMIKKNVDAGHWKKSEVIAKCNNQRYFPRYTQQYHYPETQE